MELNQYEIVLLDLNPTVGKEINKTRPCVILSPNELNSNLSTIIVAPMTSTIKKYPSRVKVTHNNRKGMIALDQLRTIDKKRIKKKLGKCSHSEIKNIKETLKEIFIN